MSAEISLTPSYWSFGAVANNSTTDKTSTISNVGDTDMTVGAMTGLSAPYSLLTDLSGTVIGTGSGTDFAVRYNPTSIGTTNQTLIINNDSTNFPAYSFGVDGTSQQAIFSITPSDKVFGAHPKDVIIDQTVSVSNSGNKNMFMGTTTLGGDLVFSLPVDNVSDATIAPDGTNIFVVRYDATSFGTYVGTYTISSDDPDHLATAFNVSGTCEQSIATITPASHSFGNHLKDSVTTTVVNVKNDGNVNLVLGTITAFLPFGIAGTSISDATITPGSSLDTTVAYIPTVLSLGDSSTLSFPSNDPASPYNMTLDGTCEQSIIGVSPTFKSFGVKTMGSTTTQVVRVSNDGNVNLILGTITAPSPFGIAGTSISDATIVPSSYADMTVAYIPSVLSNGDASTLSIPSNDPVTPSYSFNMDGTCQQSIIGVSPTLKSFGSKALDSTTNQVVRVSNTGNVNLIISSVSSPTTPYWHTGASLDATIAPAAYSDTTYSYRPTTLGASNSSAVISSNDPVTPSYTFNMDGTCEQVVIGISPTYKSFGTKAETSTTDQTVTVTNSGNLPMVTGVLSGLAAPFSAVNDNVSGKTFNSNGDSSTVVIRYHPMAFGASSDALIIPSNDPVTPSFSLGMDGTAGSASNISVSPANYDFGLVPCNFIADVQVTVSNLGDMPLVMTAVSGLAGNANPFSVINDNVSGQTIEVSGSRTLTVRFLPRRANIYTNIVSINSNDPDTPSYSFVVTGNSKMAVNHGEGRRSVSANNGELRDYIS